MIRKRLYEKQCPHFCVVHECWHLSSNFRTEKFEWQRTLLPRWCRCSDHCIRWFRSRQARACDTARANGTYKSPLTRIGKLICGTIKFRHSHNARYRCWSLTILFSPVSNRFCRRKIFNVDHYYAYCVTTQEMNAMSNVALFLFLLSLGFNVWLKIINS